MNKRSSIKWVIIGWSIFCLFGVCNIGSVAVYFNPEHPNEALLGLFLFWLVMWGLVAIPALVIFLLLSKPK